MVVPAAGARRDEGIPPYARKSGRGKPLPYEGTETGKNRRKRSTEVIPWIFFLFGS